MSTLAQNMNADRFTPKYVELARKLLREIAEKGLVKGDRLPTEVGIAEQYKLSRVTVRQALDLLESEGIVSRVRARGTFVNKAVDSIERFGVVSGTILLICSNEQRSHVHENAALATVLCDIEQTLSQRGFTVQLTTLSRQLEADRARLQTLRESTNNLRGAIVLGRAFDPYRDLLKDLIVVTLGTFQPTQLPWVGTDIAHTCQESITHLLNHGHRKIAMVCSNDVDHAALAEFLSGYQKAYDEAGVKWQRSLVYHCHPQETLEVLADQVLDGPIQPTAVFAENWQVCQAFIAAAERKGLNIPDDLSMIGFGLNVLEINDPVPITAHVPEPVSEVAAKLLADLIAEECTEPAGPIYIPGKMRERGSVRNLSRDPETTKQT